MVKVSVILTTYNSERSLRRTLNSILKQEGVNKQFDLELIVVDDCSTDNTLAILKENNIHYFSTGNNSGGPNKGRNIGIQTSSGDYICIADHDDEWLPNKINSLLAYAGMAPIITSGYTLIDTTTRKQVERINRDQASSEYISYAKNATFLTNLAKSGKGQNTYLGSILYQSALKHVLFEEHFGVVDFDWGLRLFHNQSSLEVCRSLYNRYVDGSNLSLNESYRARDFYFTLFTLDHYFSDYPSQYKQAYKKTHGSRARFYYMTGDMKKARFYFRRAEANWKTIFYYLTTFVGASFVKKRFNIFG